MRIRSILELPEAMRADAAFQLGPGGLNYADGLPPPVPNARKYRNEPTVVDGERFDSKLEGRCYTWLKQRRDVLREVLWFTRQVPFVLEGGVRYRADFLAVLVSGGVEVLDAKGRDTPSSSNKRKQVKARYGVEVQLWRD